MDYEAVEIIGNGCRIFNKSAFLLKNNFSKNVLSLNKPIEAVFITPVLTVGGAEQWIRMVIGMSQSTKIHWSIILTRSAEWHPIIINAIENIVDLYAVGNNLPQAKSFVNLQEAIKFVEKKVNVFVTWGEANWPLPTKLPIVMVSHGTDKYTKKLMDWALEGGATHFVAVSESSKLITANNPKMNTKVIWNSVDVNRLIINKDPDDIRLNYWKVTNDWWRFEDIYVGFIGRLAIEKNLFTIVKAVDELPFYFKCIFIGAGIAYKEISMKAKEFLGDRFYCHPSVDDVGNHYNALDVSVAVSKNEANSFSLIEAMYCGCPIVTTRTGAVAEFEILAGQELFISLPDMPTVSETAIAIRKAVSEGKNATRVVAAKKFAQEYLAGSIMADNWTNYLTEIVSKK